MEVNPPGPKVNADTLAAVNERLDAVVKPVAVKWFVEHGWLKPGDDISELSQYRGRRLVIQWWQFFDLIFPEEARRRREAQEAAERKAMLKTTRDARMRQIEQMRPLEYDTLCEEDSPRPRQFKLVAEFLVEDTSLYNQDERIAKMNGLVLFGPSRTGKTAACWELIERYWDANPYDDVVFLKSVRFVRIAKSRHLGADAKAGFEELFDRALSADLLVLDDLGTEKLPESAEEVLFELIDTRTENHRFTIITTNSCLEDLGRPFSPKNTEKILGRIRQFFQPVNFEKP